MDMMKRVPAAEQASEECAKNFKEVCLGCTEGEARAEASRCLNCRDPRCVAGCPVSISIPAFLQQIITGQKAKATGIIAESSVLPTVYGCVRPQETQCEGVCIHGIKGEPITIGRSERYVADWAHGHKLEPENHSEKNGQCVAVIGAGPMGFAYAGDLVEFGYEVKILEALHELDGMLAYGIPEFQLPKDTVATHEVGNVRKLDVEIETNTIVGESVSVDDLLGKEGYDVVFIGSSADLPMFMHIPGKTASDISSVNESLMRNNLIKAFREDYDMPISAGKRAVVVGDGNVAVDTAQAALRLGAEAHIVYRRSEAEFPTRAEEVHHAEEEDAILDLLTSSVGTLQDEDGWVRGVRMIHMKFGELGQLGRRRPVEIPGSEEGIPTDTVIMAFDTSPNPLPLLTTEGLETNRKGCLIVDEKDGQTTREDVLAGGDAVIDTAAVILVMGAGRQAARGIDECPRSKRTRL